MKKFIYTFLSLLLMGCAFAKLQTINPLIYGGNAEQWTSDHSPGASETTTMGTVLLGDTVYDTVHNTFWRNKDNTLDAMTWSQIWTSDSFTPTMMNNPLGVSLEFGTSRTPNAAYDTLVTASIAQTSTVLTPADAFFQINYGSGFVTVGEFKLSGLAASMTTTSTYPVPMGDSYQIVNSSGTNAIAYLHEITQ